MTVEQLRAKTTGWPWYQPWVALATFSAVLNFLWEMVVMPAYEVR